jgi:hypothetical protein
MLDKLSEADRIKEERYIEAERERLNSIKDGNN